MVRIVSEGSVPVVAEASGAARLDGAMLDDGGAILEDEDEATNGVCARAGNPPIVTTTANRHTDHFV